MATPLGLTLPLKLGANGYFENTTDVLTQIKSNLINLLLTRKGERVYQPDFGCDIYLYIFESQTDDNMSNIQASIESAVQTWMPFVAVKGIEITKNPDQNTLKLQVSFNLKTNANIGGTITLEF